MGQLKPVKNTLFTFRKKARDFKGNTAIDIGTIPTSVIRESSFVSPEMADRNFWIVEGAILFELTDDDNTQCAVRATILGRRYVMGVPNSVLKVNVFHVPSTLSSILDLLFDPSLPSNFY